MFRPLNRVSAAPASDSRPAPRRACAAAALIAIVSLAPLGAARAATKTTAKKLSAPPANPCPPATNTTVAAMTNTKYNATIRVYTEPDETKQPLFYLAVGSEFQGAGVFTVNKTEGGWLNVNVPQRPNGVTGWIKASEVHTYQHSYYMRLQLGARRLTVCNSGRVIQQETVGVGISNRPTPTGLFYTVDLIKPKGGPNGPYGPYAFGLSGFSETVFDFAGGDGRLGLHGTNKPALLGTPASSGCIRVSNAAITKLAKTLPLGVPIQISA
jgi:lipoprotein-anchoring transpeptidase ErfK/SrfK